MRVLVTRPLADAERTAARLRAMGHDSVLAPVLSIERTAEPPPPGPFDAPIVTSAHAAAALADLDAARTLPVFAVGRRTAAAVAAVGFSDIRAGAGDGAALAEVVERTLKPGARLLHVAGRDRKPEPGASLAIAGYRVEVWTAYAALAARRLPAAAQAALNQAGLDAALHYSRRSAAVLLDLVHAADLLRPCLDLEHLCLSEDAAAPLREAGARRIIVAEKPDEEALLAKMHRGGSRHAGRRNERPGSQKAANETGGEGTNPSAPVSLSSSPQPSSPPEEAALTDTPPDLANPRPRRTGPFREPPTIDLKATVVPSEPAGGEAAKGDEPVQDKAEPAGEPRAAPAAAGGALGTGAVGASASDEAAKMSGPQAEPVPSLLGESATPEASGPAGEPVTAGDTLKETSGTTITLPADAPAPEIGAASDDVKTQDTATPTPSDTSTTPAEAGEPAGPTAPVSEAKPIDLAAAHGDATPTDAPLAAGALPTTGEAPSERKEAEGTGTAAEDRVLTDAAQAATPATSESTPVTPAMPVDAAEPRRGPGAGALLGTSLLGGLIGAGLALGGQTFVRGSDAPNAGLDARLGQLEQRLGATAPRDAVGALERRITALDTEQKALAERLRAVQQGADANAARPAAGPAPAVTPPVANDVTPRLDALESQLRALAQAAGQVQANAEATRAVQERLSGIDTQVRDFAGVRQQIQANTDAARSLTQRLGDQDQRLAALAKQLTDRNPADAINAGLRVVVADRLDTALQESVPLGPALNVLRRLDVDPQALAALEPFAAQAAPNAAELTRTFKPISDRIIAESRPPAPPNPTLGDRLWGLADQIVKVRPASETQASDPSGSVARINAALAAGDLKAAAAAWDALPESARRLSDDWGRRVKQRVAAEDAAQAIADRALSALDASAR